MNDVNEVVNVRKLELLHKAARVFAEKGYQVVTVQEIADDMSLSKGGLYWHFKSKEELYIQVCSVNCTSSVAAIQSILDLDKLTFEIVFNGLESLLISYLNDPLQVSLILDFYAESKRVSAIHGELIRLSQQREEKLCVLIQRMADEKIVRPVEDVALAARMLSNQLIGMLFKFNILQNQDECVKELSALFRMLFDEA